MNKYVFLILVAFLYLFILDACTQSGTQTGDVSATSVAGHSKEETLNLSIVLDLSDRLERDNVIPSQFYNDTAIVNYFIDYFINYCKGQKVFECKNKFQILFYPSPKIPNINNLSKDLRVDLSNLTPDKKYNKLLGMKSVIDNTLDVIYSKTFEAKSWPGCDIWDFFSNKTVDRLCIKEGCRNVVAILTDGYLYDANHVIKVGKTCTFVSPGTLKAGLTLISKRNDLTNVEVIMLEVNPYSPNERDPLVKVLSKWFVDMGLHEDNFSIIETDIETRTETTIANFLNH